jgi:C-terminal processing protease CtpA/Prc
VLALNAPPPPDLADPPKNEGGIARVDRLEGDIGYIDIVQFPRTSFAPALDEAMRTLEGTKALIIDVRRNGGGSPASVDYLVSYFTAASAPLHLNDIIWRNPSTETFRTEKFFTVPTPTKYLGRPIYVLTSKDTFSAGEECAYDLKTQKLAVLVGEVTGGGANPGKVFQLGPEFIMIMPTGRALNPVTHTNWEGRGVRPDIPALGSDALRVALGQLRAADR